MPTFIVQYEHITRRLLTEVREKAFTAPTMARAEVKFERWFDKQMDANRIGAVLRTAKEY
jgi:hypothetical protein